MVLAPADQRPATRLGDSPQLSTFDPGGKRVPRRWRDRRPGRGPGRFRSGGGRQLYRPAGPWLVFLTLLFAALAGVAAAWLPSGTGDSQELREARIRQGLLAGSVADAACGLLLTNFFVVAVFMMVIGPLGRRGWLAGSSRAWRVRLVGFEPHGAGVVSCGQVHVAVQSGGQAALGGRINRPAAVSVSV